MDNKKKALKARNDYLLGIESANASINRYFADDCSDLMDVSKNIKLKDLSICQS
jgi:SLIT-ROBO Rho GTPase activating protein